MRTTTTTIVLYGSISHGSYQVAWYHLNQDIMYVISNHWYYWMIQDESSCWKPRFAWGEPLQKYTSYTLHGWRASLWAFWDISLKLPLGEAQRWFFLVYLPLTSNPMWVPQGWRVRQDCLILSLHSILITSFDTIYPSSTTSPSYQ